LTFISEIKKIQPWIVFYKFDNFTEKAMGSSSQGKRAPKMMTRRMKAVAACAAHLKDLSIALTDVLRQTSKSARDCLSGSRPLRRARIAYRPPIFARN
jgi:hypothetical protein